MCFKAQMGSGSNLIPVQIAIKLITRYMFCVFLLLIMHLLNLCFISPDYSVSIFLHVNKIIFQKITVLRHLLICNLKGSLYTLLIITLLFLFKSFSEVLLVQSVPTLIRGILPHQVLLCLQMRKSMYIMSRAPDKKCKIISIDTASVLSSPNPMFDHFLESSQ